VVLIGASVKVEALIAAQFRERERTSLSLAQGLFGIGSLDSKIQRFTLLLSLPFYLHICLYGTANHYLFVWIVPHAPCWPRQHTQEPIIEGHDGPHCWRWLHKYGL